MAVEQYLFKTILSVDFAIKWLCIQESCNKPNIPEKKNPGFTPQWTADIIDLVEIVMALHERGAINNGEVSITDTINFFFNLFNLKPGNFFSTYAVMRNRANSKTLFLDKLKKLLENKMDRDDNKHIKRKQRK